MFDFKISQTSGRSRSGLIKTSRGNIETPIFMPVGTLGTVKSLTPEDLSACGAQIILGNTYHLYLRPGCEVIDRFEGLHNFMHWDKPILTDSGGFQVFSLAKLSKITEQGYSFQSHLDGSSHLLTPERSIEVQLCLNSDIIMCLDQCLPYPATDAQTHEAMLLTTRWAERCKHVWEAQAGPQNALFGIVQGGMNKTMRQQSAQAIADIGFNGYAIGGLSVGEPKDLMWEMADHTLPYLPDDVVHGVPVPNIAAAVNQLRSCSLQVTNGGKDFGLTFEPGEFLFHLYRRGRIALTHHSVEDSCFFFVPPVRSE